MKRVGQILGALVAMLVLAQLKRPDHTNPPVTGEIEAPAEVKALLKRACFDCHSNETVWPWYSNVAPVSWVVSHHVDEGRRELNFSEWKSYSVKKQAHKMEEADEQIGEGEMPMGGYVALHAQAKLTDAEKTALQTWAKALKAELEAPPPSPAPVEPKPTEEKPAEPQAPIPG